jgi:iron(II)-dependent oxidoreductase
MESQAESLIHQLTDARQRTCALMSHLSAEQMMGPRLETTNPLRWEIGHIAYFYEYWILRHHFDEPPLIPDIDELFDSIHIPHDTRWDLKLPGLEQTHSYMEAVKEKVIQHISNGEADPVRDYLTQYAIYHEDMHCEAFTYTRQTLNYPAPDFISNNEIISNESSIDDDVLIPAGTFELGAVKTGNDFVFDNEKWSHAVEVNPFCISRYAVCNKQFAEFVESGGYQNHELWTDEGWQWKVERNLMHPVYWRNRHSNWEVRWFDRWYPMQEYSALVNVSWFEAQAYCRWAKRRLPTELEWEVAAAGEFHKAGKQFFKRHYPWGVSQPDESLVNMDGWNLGPRDVRDLPEGDSASGCRQMIGNVWEWTDTTFSPYPGFTPDMYSDYSQPLFFKTKVLRGGSFATRSRLIRNSWRNYYGPDRNDIFAGFRTCAV